MGAGKTVVGALVALRADARFHDLDMMVEDEAGMAITDLFATRSEAAFRAIESRLLPRALEPGSVAALGGGTPIDDDNWRLISERADTAYLEVPFVTIWRRIRDMSARPLAAGRSREDLEALFDKRRGRYEQAAHRVDGDRPVDVVASEILKLWSV